MSERFGMDKTTAFVYSGFNFIQYERELHLKTLLLSNI